MNILLEENKKIQKFNQGHILFKEGDIAEHFYLLLSGKVTCFKKSNERLVPVLTAEEKQIVGEDCILANSDKYFYSAVVMEDSQLVAIDRSKVFEYLNLQKEWMNNILKNIAQKIQHTMEMLAEHRIIDSRISGEIDFSQQDEAQLKKSLNIN